MLIPEYLPIKENIMTIATAWLATAFNTAPDSQNEIHSDKMAKEFGFKGGLVPGVTVSAYLMHPAVEAWGEDFLNHGRSHVVVDKPLYDGSQFKVELTDQTEQSYHALLTDKENTRCANGFVEVSPQEVQPAQMRGDPILQKGQEIPDATRDNMERLRDSGMFALATRWGDPRNRSGTYLKDANAMPELLNEAGGRFANMSYLLAITNWVLAGNAYMNPWIHLQTDSQNYAAVPFDSELIAECAISDLFEKKGHEFVDLDVNMYFKDSGEPVMTAELRAIYKLRGAA